ncbi:MAG: YhfX family PLP-dependent enzyme [Culicoidibacterales bacterium]
MFLTMTEKRNEALLKYATTLHQTGLILPDTYVIDVDGVVKNAEKLSKEAQKAGIDLFYMTKQIGRNPYLAQKISAAGIKQAVVVDYKEALVLMEQGLPIANIGHLVQIPSQLLAKIIAYGVSYITAYSVEMLVEINEVAQKLGVIQKVLLRVINEGDRIYEGQYGGFKFEKLEAELPKIILLTAVEVSGVTSFPCFLYDEQTQDFRATKNTETLHLAKELLNKNGFTITEINMPSATCVRSIPFIREIGGTQGEPGHALTGTTPMHAKEELAERPALIYVSEVSHTFEGKTYCYGGGYYRRGNLTNAKIINKTGEISYTTVNPLDNESIDYYLELENLFAKGSTVLMAFRTQIFVTRSNVALVEGLSTNSPRLVGTYDSVGKKIEIGAM